MWQKAKMLPHEGRDPAFIGRRIWIEGQPQTFYMAGTVGRYGTEISTKTFGKKQDRSFETNIRIDESRIAVFAESVELLSEFAEHVELINFEDWLAGATTDTAS